MLSGQDQAIQLIMEAAVDFNATMTQLLIPSETVKNRQATSAALQILHFVLVIVYFLVLAIIATCKAVKNNRVQIEDDQMEMIIKKLQGRREQRKSAARIAAAKATPQ